MCGGIVRVFRPTPITSPSRCVIGTTAASHAIRRELSALTLTPSTSERPGSPSFSSVAISVWTATWNRSARVPDSPPNPAAKQPAAKPRVSTETGEAPGWQGATSENGSAI